MIPSPFFRALFSLNERILLFRGWKELLLVTWVKFISARDQFETNPDFAEKILVIVARSFNKCSNNDQVSIKEILSQKRCIPTKDGMLLPEAAYFPNVNLFPDLPTVSFKNVRVVEKLLQTLGVRKVGLFFPFFFGLDN